MRYITASLFILVILGGSRVAGQQEDTSRIKPSYHEVNFFVEDNEACFKCHGERTYELVDTMFGNRVVKQMTGDNFIHRDEFYTSVHKSTSCTDCHSYDFMEFPHPLAARVEEPYSCLNCHGYDETYAQYNFEEIQVQYDESIHVQAEGFSCYKCHDPHTFQVFMRNAEDIKKAIVYDNNICLECHANYDNFLLYTDREEINIMESHQDWLPNQPAHFASVRCIECHTEISDSVLIAHKILPAEQSVRQCTECHSSDSRLMHTLYKFQSREERKIGFINGVILNDALVVGTNQNPFLNRVTIGIFALTLLAVLVHAFFRFRYRKEH